MLVLGAKVLGFSRALDSESASYAGELARRSVAAIPGLSFCEVRIAVPQSPKDYRDWMVTGFGVAPRLYDYAESTCKAHELADSIIEFYANRSKVKLGVASDDLECNIVFVGILNIEEFYKNLKVVVADSGCKEVRKTDILSQDSVAIEVSGTAEGVSAIVSKAARGIGPDRLRAHIVDVDLQVAR